MDTQLELLKEKWDKILESIRDVSNHHTATSTKAIPIAVSIRIPSGSEPNTITRHNTKGTQLPIYPHAYPCDDT